MLCQLCGRNVALIKARIENATAHICIPCGLKLMDDDKEIQLEMKRGLNEQEEKEEEQDQSEQSQQEEK